jgi:hypothetical protein
MRGGFWPLLPSIKSHYFKKICTLCRYVFIAKKKTKHKRTHSRAHLKYSYIRIVVIVSIRQSAPAYTYAHITELPPKLAPALLSGRSNNSEEKEHTSTTPPQAIEKI